MAEPDPQESDPLQCTVEELVARAGALAAAGGRRVLGITGPPGAGKSTVAAAVVAALGADRAVLVGMDGFHLAQAELVRLGRADRKGAVDTFDVGGYVALLDRLVRQEEPVVYAPLFDRSLEEPVGSAVPVAAEVPLVVTEGNYLLVAEPPWDRVRPLLDSSWYVDTDDTLRVDRLVARHHAHGRAMAAARAWATGSDERNAAVVAATRERADLVVRLRG